MGPTDSVPAKARSEISRRAFVAAAAAAGAVSWTNLTIINKARAARRRCAFLPGPAMTRSRWSASSRRQQGQGRIQELHRRRADAAVLRADAERHVRRDHQRRRICAEIRRAERPGAAEQGGFPGI